MSRNWGENIQGAEQATLSDFASQLESHIALDATKETPKDVDIREEAEILLSLLSAKPPSQSPSIDQDNYTYSSEYQELIRRDPSFSFTIPILSLDSSSSHQSQQDSTICPTQTSSSICNTLQGSSPSTAATLAPAQLLSRQLVGDGSSHQPEKHGETMARNLAESFHKAVEWRIQTWIHCLSSTLVKREKALNEAHASDDIIHELLDTAEAQVLLCLQKAASDIKVVDTKTNLRVLSQRINRGQEQGACAALKKRKVEDGVASLETESEYKYSVTHGLSFESTMNLETPAGYTEVTIEAPGFIEGSFLSSDLGEDTLTGISVEVDTNVLAMAIERSSRIVARTATHAIIPSNEEESEDEEEDVPKEQTEEFTPSPTLNAQKGLLDKDDEATDAVLVTPHKTASSTTSYEVTDNSPMIPEDFNNAAKEVVRMVSPQPRSPEYLSLNFTPRTPQQVDKTAGVLLNLVSPQAAPPTPSSSSKTSSEDEGSPSMSARKSPSLPALLQVASAAMEAC